MIQAIHSYSQHTVLGIVAEGMPALWSSLSAAVNRVALSILVQVIISLPLFYLHHNLFALGFVAGFIFDQQVRNTMVQIDPQHTNGHLYGIAQKVNVVYSAQRSALENVLLFGGGGLLAILAMPTSMVIATLYYSSQWGALLYQSSLARHRSTVQAPTSVIIKA
jgi:hypothetical protein